MFVVLTCATLLLSPGVVARVPHHIYLREPMRTSRVLEAALRAADQSRIIHPMELSDTLTIYSIGAAVTNPVLSSQSTDLMTNKRLALRSCSQLVTTLKAINQPLAPALSTHPTPMRLKMDVASFVSYVPCAVHAYATGGLRCCMLTLGMLTLNKDDACVITTMQWLSWVGTQYRCIARMHHPRCSKLWRCIPFV